MGSESSKWDRSDDESKNHELPPMNVDPNTISAAGISGGGFMSN